MGEKMSSACKHPTSLKCELDSDTVTLVLPHSSASGWECWAEASAHKPPSSSPPLMDLTEPGRSRAAGSPHGCLTEKHEYKILLALHCGGLHGTCMHASFNLITHLLGRYWCVNTSIINSRPLLLHSSITPDINLSTSP